MLLRLTLGNGSKYIRGGGCGRNLLMEVTHEEIDWMGVVLPLLPGKSLFHKMGNVIRVQMWVDESIFKMRKLFHVGACRLFFLHHALANKAHHDRRSIIIDHFHYIYIA